MKILHLPTSVGGNSFGLSRGERALGLVSDVMYQNDTWLKYPADILLSKSTFYPTIFLNSVAAALKYPKNYDVLHFNFGQSLIDVPEWGVHHWDLPLYKNKRLVVTYNGCDARQKYRCINEMPINGCSSGCSTYLCSSQKRDEQKTMRAAQFEKAGAVFFSLNPDLMHFLPESTQFLPYTVAGWDGITTAPVLQNKGKITVVHAPTNKLVKGSDKIISAVNALQQKYPSLIDFKLVEGISHDKALKIYAEADIVIDQILLGWYGGFAVEVMKMGKPVMCYIRDEDLGFVPSQLAKDCRDAVINVCADTIYDTLESYVTEPSRIQRQSQKVLEYVHRWHEPMKVAEITKAAYEK